MRDLAPWGIGKSGQTSVSGCQRSSSPLPSARPYCVLRFTSPAAAG
jgi:hypothetical protein